jgi:hypothetical protein
MKKQLTIAAAVLSAGVAAQAATVFHGGFISNTTTWAASDTHNMTNRVTVLPGATLIIEPGTTIASDGGSLAVTAGAQIFAKGTADAPITFTSVNEDGSWRAVAQEWGSLAIMGEGIISSHFYKGSARNGTASTPAAVGTHTRTMEGLLDLPGDAEEYGGMNDDDDSGTLSYVSFRYGGQVLELDSELNGLSLGGVGRETQIDHIEIMNNVDDGIEIWGGTVCMKYVSIWNIGDDSLDCDQGWRGKVQHGLIVQGYSILDSGQGSGIGDNCIEMDGSEDSDCEPHTTSTLYNFTVIGNHTHGDHAIALRENCRLQIRNSIFMDTPDVFLDEETDGDGGSGWGYDVGDALSGSGGHASHGTALKAVPNMEDTYGIAFNANTYSNDLVRITAAGLTDAGIYWAQTDGYMNEVTDTILYNINNKGGHVGEIEFNGYAGWDVEEVTTNGALPIVSYARGSEVTFTNGLTVSPVVSLDPRAAGDAVAADSMPTNDGFFDQVSYRGAFSENNIWLWDGSAAVEYGFVDNSVNTNTLSFSLGALEQGVTFSFASELGVEYSVQRATVVSGPYTEVATLEGTGTALSYIDTSASATAFYKVVAQ